MTAIAIDSAYKVLQNKIVKLDSECQQMNILKIAIGVVIRFVMLFFVKGAYADNSV